MGIQIVYADDNSGDILLLEKAFEKHHRPVKVIPKNSGKDALEYVIKSFNEAEPSDVLILDHNMPGHTGMEILRALEGFKWLVSIPVILFTSMAIDKLERNWINGLPAFYIQKPMSMQGYEEVTAKIQKIVDKFHAIEAV
jgi:response regulator RpfG family c-di-GMP phosphodiesterase